MCYNSLDFVTRFGGVFVGPYFRFFFVCALFLRRRTGPTFPLKPGAGFADPSPMADRSNTPDEEATKSPIEPIRMVERELTRPDGTKIKVTVPVYPPFQLSPRSPGDLPRPPRKASLRARQKRRRKTG